MNEFELKIRRGKPEDAEVLAPLAVKIFKDTFAENPLNKPEDMQAYISQSMSVRAFRMELEDTKSIFYFAEMGDEMIGYAMLREGSTEDCVADKNPIELNRLYVLHEFHGKGIAEIMMNKCFEIATEKGYKTMWLGVWEYNYRAARFYEKLGFKKIGNHIFQLGSDAQTDLVMEKAL
jgi:diamine N-acetyltransferase